MRCGEISLKEIRALFSSLAYSVIKSPRISSTLEGKSKVKLVNSSVSFTTKRTNALRLQASAFEASILLDSNAGDREFCYSNGAGSYYGLSNPVYVYASIVSDEE